MNRAIGQTLVEYDPNFATSTLASVPLFVGDSVATDQLIIVAWKWSANEGTFKQCFGIDGEKAQSIFEEDSAFQLRGFFGHAGRTEGQLYAELNEDSWLLSSYLASLKDGPSEIGWYDFHCQERPELGFLANPPDDPTLN